MAYKVISDRTVPNKRDSMFYKSTEHIPLKVVEYNGRQFQIEPFGEVEFYYDDQKYGCLSEVPDIKSDDDFVAADESGRLVQVYHNWYEVRPVMEDENSPYKKYVYAGLYDDVWFDPDDLDIHLCIAYIEAEEQNDKEESWNTKTYK